MAELTRRQTLSGVIALAIRFLPILPALYLVALIARYGVNVPFADEFMFTPLLQKAHAHTLTAADLFSQHNEHRYFFTRPLFIAIALCFHGDFRAEMFFSVFLAFLTLANLWRLLRKNVALSPAQRTLLLSIFSLLLFSPVQAENWTWGIQFPLFFTNYLFTCAVLVTFSRLPPGIKFLLCAALAFLANFSFGGGVLLWAVTFPFGILAHGEMRWKSRIAWGLAWVSAGLGALALYFYHYVRPGYLPSLAASRNPIDYFLYITTFLGAHLSRAQRSEPIFQATLVGTILLGLWGVAVAYAVRSRRDLELRRRMLPWLAIGSYAVLNALLASAARIGFGIHQALESRYTSFSLYLSIAVAVLLVILKEEFFARNEGRSFRDEVPRLEAVLLTAFALFSLTAFLWGRSSMIASHRDRLWGKGALLFSNVADTAALHDRLLVADASYARTCANRLNSLGLLKPPMFPTAAITQLNVKQKSNVGFLDFISITGSSCSVVGWAILPNTGNPAHCVMLSYNDPERGPIAFRMADEIYEREDVAAVLKNPAAEASGWKCHFDRSILPAGDILLTAWAVDANHAVLYPLETPQVLH